MNTTMSAQETLPLDETNPCRLVLLSEGLATHAAALEVGQRILSRFDAELDFDLGIWTFSDLENLVSAHHAAEALARADILVLSVSGHDLAAEASKWLESVAGRRCKSTGALALTVGPSPNPDPFALRALVLRVSYLAIRLRMDFLPLLPPETDPGTGWVEPLALQKAAREESDNNHWGLNE